MNSGAHGGGFGGHSGGGHHGGGHHGGASGGHASDGGAVPVGRSRWRSVSLWIRIPVSLLVGMAIAVGSVYLGQLLHH